MIPMTTLETKSSDDVDEHFEEERLEDDEEEEMRPFVVSGSSNNAGSASNNNSSSNKMASYSKRRYTMGAFGSISSTQGVTVFALFLLLVLLPISGLLIFYNLPNNNNNNNKPNHRPSSPNYKTDDRSTSVFLHPQCRQSWAVANNQARGDTSSAISPPSFEELDATLRKKTTALSSSSSSNPLCLTNPSCSCPPPWLPKSKPRDRWKLQFRDNEERLKQRMAKSAPALHSHKNDTDSAPSPPLLMIVGDSIVEGLLGTYLHEPMGQWQGNRDVFTQMFSSSSRESAHSGAASDGGSSVAATAVPMGISGDETHHVLWRLQNGELPDSEAVKTWTTSSSSQRFVVFWITVGTNNVGVSHCSADAVVVGIWQIVEYIQEQYKDLNIQIVINSLFPRGDGKSGKLGDEWRTLKEVNAKLCQLLSPSSSSELDKNHQNVWFVDLTDRFLTGGQTLLHLPLYQSDGLHLSASGTRIWLQAMQGAIQDLISMANPRY